MCPSIESFLRSQDAARIREYLTDEVEEAEAGYDAMRFVKQHRPDVYNEVLCLLYDIANYKTGDTCFAATAPLDTLDKFFISVPAGGQFADELPAEAGKLFDTYEAANAAAVQAFELERLFFGEAVPA